MAISWNEIKSRSLNFSKEWENETSERAEAQTFWNEFFQVFGRNRRRVASFEINVTTGIRKNGRIDLLWKGNLLIEHKSWGSDLNKAHQQAIDYFPGLKDSELPKLIIVCDFQNFKIYDLDDDSILQFQLKDLHKNLKPLGFIAGYKRHKSKEEDAVNIQAALLMGKLHDQLEKSGYEGHNLEVFLVRLLFCLFADDTGIFEKDIFIDAIEVKTNEDGCDLGSWLAQLFQVLNTPNDKRFRTLDEDLATFPYVNGRLFEEVLPIPAFNSKMRAIILECSGLNWGEISPAIFGSMFQSVMNAEERKNLGAHYTSEKNILKLIKPLFLDDLNNEFNSIKSNKNKLKEFHQKLGTLKFLDPACGCGNFLVITYRELRLLEMKLLHELYGSQQTIDIEHITNIDVDQFFGIEYDEWPARIAEVALWLMDHQMNLLISEAFGIYYARLPLKKTATIVCGNALRINWTDLVPINELSYILGNPPFYGKHLQTKEQKKDMAMVFHGVSGAGVLDYVSAWYLRAAQFIQGTNIKCSFVSTNSITQGEQVGVLWQLLFTRFGIKILFAHRTFKWRNEAKSNAAVHVVIIGFANFDTKSKLLFEYEDINGDPSSKMVNNINPYLVEGIDNYVLRRKKKICSMPDILWGSKPVDDGNFILTNEEKQTLLEKEPNLKPYIRKYIGAEELLHNKLRYTFWLKGANPSDIKNSSELRRRINAVKQFRQKSKKAATNKMAAFPTLFAEIREPKGNVVVIPEVSSENRQYIPIGTVDESAIISNRNYMLINISNYHFGVLTSLMHNAWIRHVAGRLESRITYSSGIVYNNFPWPNNPDVSKKKNVELKAQKVLDIRNEFPNNSLADLYDPNSMPPELVKAHKELDKAVDLAYRPQPFTSEANRMVYLFELYEKYTSDLFSKDKLKSKKRILG